MKKRACRTFLVIVFVTASSSFGQNTELPLGAPGLVATYQAVTPTKGDSSVATISMTLGPIDIWQNRHGQWLHLEAVKTNGVMVQVWVLCEAFPSEELSKARAVSLRYILKQGDNRPVEFRHGVTGLAVLPWNGAWPYLLPRSASDGDILSKTVTYLGHTYARGDLVTVESTGAPEDIRVVTLRPDVLTGLPHNTRQADETRRYDDSEYDYVPLTQDDLETLIAAGANCFRAEPDSAPWFEEAGVFYWGVGGADVAYPECLYQPQYIGPALFLDEPAVVTRDSMIRPRLREDPEFRKSISPQAALAYFEEHYAHVIDEGAPTQLLGGLAARDDVDLGGMQFLQTNLYSWETMVSSAAYQLLYNSETPGAIVFEPPGQLGARRTLPAMNMSYGCQIPVTSDNFIDIIIGYLRGAARASGKEWGISIYGGVDVAEAPRFFSRAYELGATRFFYWDSARLACVPFGEVLDLSRRLKAQSELYPNRDLAALRDAAEVAILLPPGYNLGHVHMGKGLLWGVDELNLERRNREGIQYRAVMSNFFVEIERCLRQGVAFDLLWDLPELKLDGYREVVRVREDGKIELIQDGIHTLLEGARVPERPQGEAPRLSVALSTVQATSPVDILAVAHITEGAAHAYYAPAPDANGEHHNLRVAWELFGPEDEDCTYRSPGITYGPSSPEADRGYAAEAAIHIEKPGQYRLRAAATDLAGRSTVVWKEITVTE